MLAFSQHNLGLCGGLQPKFWCLLPQFLCLWPVSFGHLLCFFGNFYGTFTCFLVTLFVFLLSFGTNCWYLWILHFSLSRSIKSYHGRVLSAKTKFFDSPKKKPGMCIEQPPVLIIFLCFVLSHNLSRFLCSHAL